MDVDDQKDFQLDNDTFASLPKFWLAKRRKFSVTQVETIQDRTVK